MNFVATPISYVSLSSLSTDDKSDTENDFNFIFKSKKKKKKGVDENKQRIQLQSFKKTY